MRKIVAFISSLCICISFVGCNDNGSDQKDISHNTFDEDKAISMIIFQIV